MSRAFITALLAATLTAPFITTALPFHHTQAAGSDVRRLTLRSETALTRDGLAHFLAWNTRGNDLLYLDGGALWLSDTTGRHRTRLVSSAVADATFTDDGTHVLYQALTKGSQPQPNGIVRIDLHGRGARRLAGADYYPMYTSAGAFSESSLASSMLRDGRMALEHANRLYALNPASGAITSLGSFILPSATEEGALPNTAAAISPDGTQVAVFGLSNGLTFQDVRRGHVLRRIVPRSGPSGGVMQPTAASWSPNGHTLIYELSGASSALMAMNTGNGRRYTLLRLTTDTLSSLTWSSNSAMLAFSDVSASSSVVTQSEIDLINANGSGRRTLDPQASQAGWIARNQPGQLSPIWAPSSDFIGYTRAGASRAHGPSTVPTDVWLARLSLK